jgi:transposase
MNDNAPIITVILKYLKSFLGVASGEYILTNGINMFTCLMAKNKYKDPKIQALRQSDSLNPHPEKVADPLFSTSGFFDARDLVQVKYEMVRRVQADRQPVSSSAKAFGFSRPSFYQAQSRLQSGGLAALVPQKPGPRSRHKLDAEVMAFLQALKRTDPSIRPPDMVGRIMERFGRRVHIRSVERALARQEKKRT